jgi:hypothetical protein
VARRRRWTGRLAWSGLQLFLTHRLAAAFYVKRVAGCARFVHGAGWVQLSNDRLTTWLFTGAVVDTLVVAAIAVALVLALRPTDAPASVELLRSLPPMIVLAGWWLMRHPLPERIDEIWLVQALAFVFAAALLATSSLPTVGTLLHHAAFAAATAAWMLGAAQLQARNKDGSASRAAMSAMT